MSQSISLHLLTSSALLAAAAVSPAQTTTPKPAVTHHTAAATTTAAATHKAEPACAKLPELSPKIPALPAGLPCARPLYTVTIEPAAKLDYISPLESPEQLRTTLGLESTNFSLDYVDTKLGTGALAAPNKWYTIHYTGYLVDGTKFDSSVDRNEPIVIAYGKHKVIPGWDTGFDGMRVGGKRRLFIPYQLAYGAAGQRTIPAKAELIFDVELIAQSDTEPAPKPPPTPPDSASPTPGTTGLHAVPPARTPPAATPPVTTAPAKTPNP